MFPLTLDGWMNVAGISGVALYLSSYFLLLKGLVTPESLWNRWGRLAGFALILTPLFMRWQLSESLLVTAGLLMAAVSFWYIYRLEER